MNKKKYNLSISEKTRILNLFRAIFRNNILEKLLVFLNLNSGWFVKKLIPPNYLYKKGSIREISRNGINYSLDISQVVDHYLYFGYKDNLFNYVKKDIENSLIIFDVGANIGTTSLFFSKLNTKSKVFSFEPHPDTFVKLEKNVGLNNFSNLNIYQLGLGDTIDTVKIYEVNRKNRGMNRVMKEDKSAIYPFKKIKINKLDNFMSEKNVKRLDFIKIDVEGLEYSVLKGGEKTLRKNKPIIILELEDNNLSENNASAKLLIEFLIDLGYNKIYRADNNETIKPNNDFKNCHFDIIAK